MRRARTRQPAATLAAFFAITLVFLARASVADTVLVPGAVMMPDGTLTPGMAVVIRDGRIHAVQPADDFEGDDDVIRRPGAVLSPGLIDPYSVLGVYGANVERVRAIDPDLSVAEAINPLDSAWREAMQEGVTAAMLVPGPNNVVGGMTAIVRTWSADHEPQVLRDEAMMMFSFGPAALSATRPPTSRSGAISMLRSAFAAASNGRGHDRLSDVIDGEIGALVRAGGGEDVTAAIRFFETYGLAPVIVHSGDLLEIREDLIEVAPDVPVILGPYGAESSHHVIVAAKVLDEAGVPIAFAGQTGARSAASLRLSAALAVRAGLDPAAARRAMTANPASIVGIADEAGSIASGRAADLVLWTADPLRPDARVLEVYIGGELAYVTPMVDDEIARIDLEDDADEWIGGSDDETE